MALINDCHRSRATGPGLKRVGGGTNLAMSSLSLPPGDLCDLKTRFCLDLKLIFCSSNLNTAMLSFIEMTSLMLLRCIFCSSDSMVYRGLFPFLIGSFADSVVQRSPRMSGAKADAELRSKTDNLERMITEVMCL